MRSSVLCGLLLLGGSCLRAGAAAPEVHAPDEWAARVEADWLLQEQVRWVTQAVTTAEDAAGGCDGVKDGKWGFHTAAESQPWWQVDLGSVQALDHVLIFNRCDAVAARCAQLLLLLSEDAQTWRQVYQHNGETFYGFTDNKPLSVPLAGERARYVRVQLPGTDYLHLDEVEVYGAPPPGQAGSPSYAPRNLALGQPADQSSLSPWSVAKRRGDDTGPSLEATARALERARKLAEAVEQAGADVGVQLRELDAVAARLRALPQDASPEARREIYLQARRIGRRIEFASPLLDFDRLLFVKRVPTLYSHMSDQNYGWWSRPGGGICVLEGLKSEAPTVRCLTEDLPPGSCNNPDLSPDAQRVVFAYCRYYPELAGLPNKVDKSALAEDGFYHLYEMNVDGSGRRQLTCGKYDDFDPRYLPDGRIVFLSTRRGQALQCLPEVGQATLTAALPDSYVRCGGDASRPVAVYTLHVVNADGTGLHPISGFENFEWTPNIAADGRVLYARWDYVDRFNGPYESLWSTNPDGTNSRIVYGNFTADPYAIFEARPIPGSSKLVFVASAHHSVTAGSVCLLDPAVAMDGLEAITRLTPEVCFPEAEGWPATYFTGPYPLSEWQYLAAWSGAPVLSQGGTLPANALGLYLCDAFGGLELIYRDPEITSMYPLPLRPRQPAPVIAPAPPGEDTAVGRFLLLDVYRGLTGVQRGAVSALRVVGVPAKTQPEMNSPNLGVTAEDPGKVVLGTVPVEADGSAHFSAPAGLSLFFQALDQDGVALQTMRTITYVQPGETQSCVGCHEPRQTAPSNAVAVAAQRPPSRLTPGPEGSWPLRFDRLVQPVLDRLCTSCHQPAGSDPAAASLDLTAPAAYATLLGYGRPPLRDQVRELYMAGRSQPGVTVARQSALLALLSAPAGHYGVQLDADARERLVTWLDVYAPCLGSFSADQEERLVRLREDMAGIVGRRQASGIRDQGTAPDGAVP